jgi:hypothetical protein
MNILCKTSSVYVLRMYVCMYVQEERPALASNKVRPTQRPFQYQKCIFIDTLAKTELHTETNTVINQDGICIHKSFIQFVAAFL